MPNRSRWYWTRRVTPAGWVLLPLGLALLLLEAFWLVVRVVVPTFTFMLQRFDVWWPPVLYLLAGLTGAGLLALLRAANQRWYGFIEVCFASVGLAATAPLAASKDMVSLSIGYIGSVYVAIRGCTNMWDTLSDERKRQMRSWFYEG